MDNKTFNLFMEVINAAKEGRYMYGNGAMWYIVDIYGQKVMINTVNGTKELIPTYNGEARTDMRVAQDLEAFLSHEEAADVHTTEHNYMTARDMVATAARRNELLFTNGNLCYIKMSGTVVIAELGTQQYKKGQGYVTNVHAMSLHAAWKYLRFNGENTRVQLDDSLKSWLGIR